MRRVDNLIIGAGPGGLQSSYFLKEAGMESLILEQSASPGSFFSTFPRHRQLISINKVHTGYHNPEKNLRWDWNSLLSSEGGLLFSQFTSDYFPAADDLVHYLAAYATDNALDIVFNTEIHRIERANGVFLVRAANGTSYASPRLILSTGLSLPYFPDIPGIEHCEHYAQMNIERDRYIGQRVLIIGKGNSGMELANDLLSVTSKTHVISRHPIRFAWRSHFVGDTRSVNTTFLDSYQLKSQNALINGEIQKIEQGSRGEMRVTIDYANAANESETITYDTVICATGFRANTSFFTDDLKPRMCHDNRLPSLTSSWESVNVPGLYFSGTLTQSRAYRKNTSGFIHGFRYNSKALVRMLQAQDDRNALDYEEWPLSPEDLAQNILTRCNTSSALWQQFGYFADCIVLLENTARVYTELPKDYLEERFHQDRRLMIALEFNQAQFDRAENTFAVERIHRSDVTNASLSPSLHPIIREYENGELRSIHHVIEDFESEWKESVHIDPLVTYLRNVLQPLPTVG